MTCHLLFLDRPLEQTRDLRQKISIHVQACMLAEGKFILRHTESQCRGAKTRLPCFHHLVLVEGHVSHVIVLADVAPAAKTWGLMKCWNGVRLDMGVSRHTRWRESGGWKEVQGKYRIKLQHCMCFSLGYVYMEESTPMFSKGHNSSVRCYGCPQWLQADIFLNPSLFPLFSSLFLSLDQNSIVIYRSWPTHRCVYFI